MHTDIQPQLLKLPPRKGVEVFRIYNLMRSYHLCIWTQNIYPAPHLLWLCLNIRRSVISQTLALCS